MKLGLWNIHTVQLPILPIFTGHLKGDNSTVSIGGVSNPYLWHLKGDNSTVSIGGVCNPYLWHLKGGNSTVSIGGGIQPILMAP